MTQLAKNLFVPNYLTTFGRKLNDRVRSLLSQEELLPGSKQLEELIEIDNSNYVRTYVDFMLDFLFKLRPQVSTEKIPIQVLVNERNLRVNVVKPSINKIKQGQANTDQINLLQYLPPVINGEEINEATFFHRGQKFYSTKYFVREWEAVKSCYGLFGQKKKPKLRRPTVSRRLKKTMGIGLIGLIGLSGTSYFFPEVRYKLKLPTTNMEKVEILTDQGEADKVVELLKEQNLSSNLFSYWKSKAILNHLYSKLSQTDNVDDKYWLANEIVRGRHTGEMRKAELEFGTKRIQEELFRLGYIKIDKYLHSIDDHSTPRLAAHSIIANILVRKNRPEESSVRRIWEMRNNQSLFYVGEKDQKAYFLNDEGERFSFQFEKKLDDNTYGLIEMDFLK